MSPRNRQSKPGKRQNQSLLNEVLEQRMLLYMLAAGASLACASAAQARVVFTPSNAAVGGNGSLQIDLDNDGTFDFTLATFDDNFSVGYVNNVYVTGSIRSNGVMQSRANGFAAALKEQALIGARATFQNSALLAHRGSYRSGGGTSLGNFTNTTCRFLGVRFLINGETHYGWIGFRSVGEGSANLLGWAYETRPNVHILAGYVGFLQECAFNSATQRTPEPTSLELLAAGNVAMTDRRRRRAG
jgi:opacity protein-like surface antigen